MLLGGVSRGSVRRKPTAALRKALTTRAKKAIRNFFRIALALCPALAMLGRMSDGPCLPLPDDLSACQALIRQQARTIDAQTHAIESHGLTIERLHQQNQELEREKQELQLAFAELLQRAFRRRSERYLENPDQLRIDFGNDDAAAGLSEAIDESQTEVATEQTVREYTRRKRLKPRQVRLPEHLPRYKVEAPTPDRVKHFPLHGERKLIGCDLVETLEFERPKLRASASRNSRITLATTSRACLPPVRSAARAKPRRIAGPDALRTVGRTGAGLRLPHRPLAGVGSFRQRVRAEALGLLAQAAAD